MYRDSHQRSAAKAVSWRILGTITTSALVFIFTRRLVLSLAVGGFEFASKIGLFWVHERIWDRIRFGRRPPKSAVVWFTGLSGAGKSTIAERVVTRLEKSGLSVEHLDGDTIRDLFPQTGFSREERTAHVHRVGYLASRLEKNGVTVIASLISPYADSRQFVRNLCDNFIEVYVATPIDECERRDPKGLYQRARKGEISNFTGIDDPYEPPANPELAIDTSSVSVDEAVELVVKRINSRNRGNDGATGRVGSTQRIHPAGSVRELQTAGDVVVDRQG